MNIKKKCCLFVLLLMFFAILQFQENTYGQGFPVPGLWQGEIMGQVHNQPFRLPLSIEIKAPIAGENNPVHLYLGSDVVGQPGNVFLMSASEFLTPYTGQRVTLQYFDINVSGNQLTAVLTNEHKGEAAVIDMFGAPNLSAQYAPQVMQEIYASLGQTEQFAFNRGTIVKMTFANNRITGTVQGTGFSYTGIFPLPDVVFQGQFAASRIR